MVEIAEVAIAVGVTLEPYHLVNGVSIFKFEVDDHIEGKVVAYFIERHHIEILLEFLLAINNIELSILHHNRRSSFEGLEAVLETCGLSLLVIKDGGKRGVVRERDGLVGC